MVQKHRKNFFPAFILMAFFWTTLGLMTWFVDPEFIKNIIVSGAYLPFFINLFLALFLTFSFIFANSRRGFLASGGIIFYLILRMHQLGNFLNIILLTLLVFVFDYYFTHH